MRASASSATVDSCDADSGSSTSKIETDAMGESSVGLTGSDRLLEHQFPHDGRQTIQCIQAKNEMMYKKYLSLVEMYITGVLVKPQPEPDICSTYESASDSNTHLTSYDTLTLGGTASNHRRGCTSNSANSPVYLSVEELNMKEASTISVKAYLTRIARKGMVSFGALLCAVAYLSRFEKHGLALTQRNLMKSLLCAVRVAAKIYDDTIIHPQDFAYLAGVDHAAITRLELVFISCLEYDLNVSQAEHDHLAWVIGITFPPDE